MRWLAPGRPAPAGGAAAAARARARGYGGAEAAGGAGGKRLHAARAKLWPRVPAGAAGSELALFALLVASWLRRERS